MNLKKFFVCAIAIATLNANAFNIEEARIIDPNATVEYAPGKATITLYNVPRMKRKTLCAVVNNTNTITVEGHSKKMTDVDGKHRLVFAKAIALPCAIHPNVEIGTKYTYKRRSSLKGLVAFQKYNKKPLKENTVAVLQLIVPTIS